MNVNPLLRTDLSPILTQVAGGQIKGKVQEDGVGVDKGPPKVELSASWTIQNHFTNKSEKV